MNADCSLISPCNESFQSNSNHRTTDSFTMPQSEINPTSKVSTPTKTSTQSGRKKVQFSSVVVYSFAREQGFCSLPDTGWCSLGMSSRHFNVSRYDLQHHQLLQRLRRRRRSSQATNSKIQFKSMTNRNGRRGCLRDQIMKCPDRTQTLSNEITPPQFCHTPSPPRLSPQNRTFIESFTDQIPIRSPKPDVPPCLSPPSPHRIASRFHEFATPCSPNHLVEFIDTDSDISMEHPPSHDKSSSAMTGSNRYGSRNSLSNGNDTNFRDRIRPLPPHSRMRLLKSSGVTDFDDSERYIVPRLRQLRSQVGCRCGPFGQCLPGICSCSSGDIPCQVDRDSYPCSCTSFGCCNPSGRVEFSQERVKSHVQHVLQRFSSSANSLDDKSSSSTTLVGECYSSCATTTTPSALSTPVSFSSEIATAFSSPRRRPVTRRERAVVKPLALVSSPSPPPPPPTVDCAPSLSTEAASFSDSKIEQHQQVPDTVSPFINSPLLDPKHSNNATVSTACRSTVLMESPQPSNHQSTDCQLAPRLTNSPPLTTNPIDCFSFSPVTSPTNPVELSTPSVVDQEESVGEKASSKVADLDHAFVQPMINSPLQLSISTTNPALLHTPPPTTKATMSRLGIAASVSVVSRRRGWLARRTSLNGKLRPRSVPNSPLTAIKTSTNGAPSTPSSNNTAVARLSLRKRAIPRLPPTTTNSSKRQPKTPSVSTAADNTASSQQPVFSLPLSSNADMDTASPLPCKTSTGVSHSSSEQQVAMDTPIVSPHSPLVQSPSSPSSCSNVQQSRSRLAFSPSPPARCNLSPDNSISFSMLVPKSPEQGVE